MWRYIKKLHVVNQRDVPRGLVEMDVSRNIYANFYANLSGGLTPETLPLATGLTLNISETTKDTIIVARECRKPYQSLRMLPVSTRLCSE